MTILPKKPRPPNLGGHQGHGHGPAHGHAASAAAVGASGGGSGGSAAPREADGDPELGGGGGGGQDPPVQDPVQVQVKEKASLISLFSLSLFSSPLSFLLCWRPSCHVDLTLTYLSLPHQLAHTHTRRHLCPIFNTSHSTLQKNLPKP